MAESYVVSPRKSHNKFSRVLHQPNNNNHVHFSRTLNKYVSLVSYQQECHITNKIDGNKYSYSTNRKQKENADKNRLKKSHLQHGMFDATMTSGDKTVVFSPKRERAAANHKRIESK